jgi:serine protease Do
MEKIMATLDNQGGRPLARRATLLASAAALGIAITAGGVSLYRPTFVEPAHAATTEAAPQPGGFADLVARVKPAVVSVRVELPGKEVAKLEPNNDEGPQPQQGSPFDRFFRQFGQQDAPRQAPRHVAAEGSGFFISPDGYAVTNNHVVDHATDVKVVTDDGHTLSAKVIGTDPQTDLALIKVEKIDGKDFTYVNWAEREPRIGDWVIAVGNPFGLGGTVTAGVVSARGRDIGSGPYNDYIQIDAPINRGNSGGPAFDINGNVIGVNTAIFSPSGGSVGIGFDIPADTAKSIVAQLKEHGHVTRGYIGVRIQPVTPEIADSLGMKKVEGALVDEATGDGPAAKAGIKSGDVITQVDGKDVKGSRELARLIAANAPGSSVQLAVLHDGAEKNVSMTLGTLPTEHQASNAGSEEHGKADNAPRLGVTVAPAAEVQGAGQEGVAVTGVDPNGPAAEHGVRTGDVILDVAGKAVSKPEDVRSQLVAAEKDGKHTVLLRMKTADGTRFVAIPLGKA